MPTIDLTGDDESEDLKRAMAMSLEDTAPTFGPSNRAPDPNWAMVPSNVRRTFQSICVFSFRL